MIAIVSLLLATAFAQTSFKPLTDEAILRKEAMARTVFIRSYQSADTSKAIRATGILLKDGFILTNEHVMRPFLQKKKVVFQIFTQGKKFFHKFEDVSLIDCDEANDLCLLKTHKKYADAYFTFESPSFRKVTDDKPIGLFQDEEIYFNGFCDELPAMKKAKYLGYTTSAYETKIQGLENRKVDTAAIQFAAITGEGIACGGDSGGPLFDANLYLYGIVRDAVKGHSGSKNFAVPVSTMREFYSKVKDAQPKSALTTITDFSQLEVLF